MTAKVEKPSITKLCALLRSLYHLHSFAIFPFFYRRNFHHNYNLWGATFAV